jgi:formate dehydrogenase (NADP+) beta subunit
VKPTNTRDPDYYHKVVDCQWACPAHTPVPEYIRLIAEGKFTEAYMINRESNMFPGILGRTCDRPCEPACRRTRVDEEPVAICRLKRVASDFREDVTDLLPKAPSKKNGKRIACIGAGPASLTVANDLTEIGYQVTIFEALQVPGGLMQTNIPRFRLPQGVIDEEIGYILDLGVELKTNHPIKSMKALIGEGYDAIFVGTGAPKGKNLEIPNRQEASDNIHIGIEWLESVAFEHIKEIGKDVLVIGVGNTAMDCCRTSKRLGGSNVRVVARKSREYFKASDWELVDAEEEQVEIIENHSPKQFIMENGKLIGMEFDRVEWYQDGNGRLVSKTIDQIVLPCTDVILAIGQDNHFPWIERDIGITFNKWEMPEVDKKTYMCSKEGLFFGGDAAWGPLNIIWAVAHGHEAAISINLYCQNKSLTERPPRRMELKSTKMGLHEWSFSNNFDSNARTKMIHQKLEDRFQDIQLEVEKGFDLKKAASEVERCLNCDVQTEFAAPLCIECDACIDICPVECLTITENGEAEDLQKRLTVPIKNDHLPLYISQDLPQTQRVMVKDEDLCVHCGLCAERCPTAAWDMLQFKLQMPYAGKSND